MIAVRKDRVLFIQIKSNKSHVSAAIDDYKNLEVPDNVCKLVVLWEDRAKEPIIKQA